MRICSACGKGLEDQARFCSQCGAVQAYQPSTGHSPTHFGNPLESPRRRLWPLGVAVIVFLTGLFIAALFYFLSNSEPAKMTVKVVRESPVIRQALGEIQDVGWANGGISTRSGGSGTANFSVSVKGSLAKGKFYAYFVKRHDVWAYDSGRLRLDNGRSINVPLP